MTTNDMLSSIESYRTLPKNFYEQQQFERDPEPPYFDVEEIEMAKRIARVLDDREGWHVAPVNGGGILFEANASGLMIEVTATKTDAAILDNSEARDYSSYGG